MKIIFMGTPLFGKNVLKSLVDAGHEICLVVTKKDNSSKPSEVKKFALENGLKLFEPENFKEEYPNIFNYPCDFLITASYGEFLPKKLLEHPRVKALNVHGSLLPKYRGGAPIQRAIINGDFKTGISIIEMTPKMDAGDIYMQEEVEITDTDTTTSLMEKLSLVGGKALTEVLKNFDEYEKHKQKQNKELVSFAKTLLKDEDHLDFNFPADFISRSIRAHLLDKPMFFNLENIRFKVYNSIPIDNNIDKAPGTILGADKSGLLVKTKGSAILITEILPEGKKRMLVKDYLNGIGKKQFVIGRRIL